MKLAVLGCGHIWYDRGLLFDGAVSREMTRVPGEVVVLSGDDVYTREHLCTCTGPDISWDADAIIRGVQRLETLARAGTQEIVAHDPDSWASLGAFRVLHEEPS